MQNLVTLPPDFTLLQVVPELETGGAEQTTIDVANAVVRAGGKALVATRGGRMAARLEADGGRVEARKVDASLCHGRIVGPPAKSLGWHGRWPSVSAGKRGFVRQRRRLNLKR